MSYNLIGLLWAKVYNEDGSLFQNASDYFFDMDESGKYTEIVSNKLSEHVKKYFPKYEKNKNVWQVEFGGDGGNGLIDYALESNPPSIPTMKFEIEKQIYSMKF
jgi:hypothetical protein